MQILIQEVWSKTSRSVFLTRFRVRFYEGLPAMMEA